MDNMSWNEIQWATPEFALHPSILSKLPGCFTTSVSAKGRCSSHLKKHGCFWLECRPLLHSSSSSDGDAHSGDLSTCPFSLKSLSQDDSMHSSELQKSATCCQLSHLSSLMQTCPLNSRLIYPTTSMWRSSSDTFKNDPSWAFEDSC